MAKELEAHEVGISALKSSLTGLELRFRFLNNTADLNDILDEGIYGINGSLNSPQVSDGIGTLIVGSSSSGWITTQIYFEVWNGGLYYRRKYNNAWGEWNQLI